MLSEPTLFLIRLFTNQFVFDLKQIFEIPISFSTLSIQASFWFVVFDYTATDNGFATCCKIKVPQIEYNKIPPVQDLKNLRIIYQSTNLPLRYQSAVNVADMEVSINSTKSLTL